jgi:hypothetical protein
MRNRSLAVTKILGRSCSIVTCLAVTTVVSNFSCVASHYPSVSSIISLENSSTAIRGGNQSETSSRRRKRKRRKQKHVIIDSDITDFGSPLIPDLSENEDEEKIIRALSGPDRGNKSSRNLTGSVKNRSSRSANHLAEDTLLRSTKRTKSKNGHVGQQRHRRKKRKKRRRKRKTMKGSKSIEKGKSMERTVDAEKEQVELRAVDEIVQTSKTAGEKLNNKPPGSNSPISARNQSEAITLPSNASMLSARQNLTSTVDESLSRLKRMNERKQEVNLPSKMVGKDQTSNSYTNNTPRAQKHLFHATQYQNQPNIVKPAPPMANAQNVVRAVRGNPRVLPVNKPTPVKQPKRTLPTTMSLTTPWARKFILSRPKDALLPIPREFLSDGFNLVQLAPVVDKAVKAMKLRGEGGIGRAPNTNADGSSNNMSLYKVALRQILADDDKGNSNSTLPSAYTPFQIQKAAEVLYTMVHARYVSSPRGLDTVHRMFKRNIDVGIEPIFGRCCRVHCKGMPLLPVGISDKYDIGGKGGASRKAMRYCPSCDEVFYMWESKVDGAAWGTSFAHLFLMAQGSEVFPRASKASAISKIRQPTRKIFGFRIHPAADVNKLKGKFDIS